jgi:hypothetical protein
MYRMAEVSALMNMSDDRRKLTHLAEVTPLAAVETQHLLWTLPRVVLIKLPAILALRGWAREQ